MEVRAEIETHDKMLGYDLFESKELLRGHTEKSVSEDASVRFEGSIFRKAEGLPEIIELTLIFAKEVVKPIILGIVSAWLYNKMKGRAVTLRIERSEVEIDKGEIEKILMEKIEKK